MKSGSGSGKPYYADALFGVVILIAASNYIVCKWALETVPPFSLIAIRYLLASLLMSAFVVFRSKGLSGALFKKSLSLGLLLTLSVISWQLGIASADHLGPSAFIVSMDGLMVPVFAWLLWRQAISRIVIVALPLAIIGLALLALKPDMSIATSDAWFVLSAVGFSLHILYTSRYAKRFDPVNLAWGQMLVVALISLLVAGFMERDKLTVAGLVMAKYEIVYLVVVASALRFTLQNYVQRHTSAVKAGLLFVLEPVVVAYLGWLLLSESLSVLQLLGCSLIFIALIVAHLPRTFLQRTPSGAS